MNANINTNMDTELGHETIDLDATVMENPTKKKRGRSNSLSLAQGTSATLLKAIEAMEYRLSDKMDTLGNRLDTKIENVKTDLLAKMAALSTIVDEKLKDKVCVDDFSKLQNNVTTLNKFKTDTEKILDKMERESLLDRLIISGVPQHPKEDLKDICCRIGSVIGSPITSINAYRIKNVQENSNKVSINPGTSKPGKRLHPSIIIKFISTEERFQFFHCYLKYKKLSLADINFEAASRIFINELLTRRNSDILRVVRKLKDDGKIINYFTVRGIIYINRTYNGITEKIPIYDTSELSDL